MVSSRDRETLGSALSLAVAGGAGAAAGSHGLWLALAGALLVVVWLAIRIVLTVRRSAAMPPAADATERETIMQRLLLDASPTPLLLVDRSIARALNRAARHLFETDDRVLSPMPELFSAKTTHVRHAGRKWRIDRVDVGSLTIAALVDVECEERTAEARASAEMIQVMGHEMLNGLLPIVALAERGVTAAAADSDRMLLSEILNTLARRAESLQRFTEAYRSLARLPPPLIQVTSIVEMIGDLARLFASRWPDARLCIAVADMTVAELDRDQVTQAIWALLQNAVEAAANSPATGIRVEIRVLKSDAHLTIDVTDNGPGIAPDKRTVIFRPFETTKATGTGIGLSLARQIAQVHGGTLALLPRTPTTFRMQMPLSHVDRD